MDNFILLYTFAVTIGTYMWSLYLNKKYSSPFTNPTFFSTLLIILILIFSHIHFSSYQSTKNILTFFLGPATVGIAIPLYKNREILFRNVIPSLTGLIVGSSVSLLVTILLLKGMHLSDVIIRSMSLKTITTPIAIEVASIIHGDRTLTAIFVVLTGMLGSMTGPWIMNKTKILDPLSRGLALGTQAHGIGTAQAATEGELQAAIAGVAMGLNGIFISVIAPMIIPWILK
jgi:putative effector of murein hydrolase